MQMSNSKLDLLKSRKTKNRGEYKNVGIVLNIDQPKDMKVTK